MSPAYLRCIGTELLSVYLANAARCAGRGCAPCTALVEMYRRELVQRARWN